MASKVAVFVGSLRKAAWSGKVAQTLIALAPSSLQLEIVEIGQLPLYNQDSDDGGNPPSAFIAFRQEVKKFDASGAQERHRRRLASLRAKCMGWQAGGSGQRFAGSDRRIRRQPSPAPIAGFSQRALPANAGSLSRRHRRQIR